MKDISQLRFFMENHIYAVWDFMCLLKRIRSLTSHESNKIWTPPNVSYESMRLINEIYLGEETDVLPDGTHASHLEIYLRAMKEVGADTSNFEEFLKTLDPSIIPEPAKNFVDKTFLLIDTGKLHVLLAGFTHGRELIIPKMFTEFLDDLSLEAPMFRYYLNRHIEVDSEDHGPAALRLLEESIGNDPIKRQEAEEAKKIALEARQKLWEEIKL